MSWNGEEEEELGYDMDGAVGITEEVLAFARNIAMHPETWLDFPGDEEDDLDGMYVSCMLECLCYLSISISLINICRDFKLFVQNWSLPFFIMQVA